MKRLGNGRFAKKVEEETTSTLNNNLNIQVTTGRGFFQDILSILSFVYKLWLIIPYLILAFVIWRYFKLQLRLGTLMQELACGEGCLCSCPLLKNASFTPNGAPYSL